MHYTNYSTPQLQLHYITTTTTAALHHPTSSSCVWGDRTGNHCNYCNPANKHKSNHLSVHQWIRSAIRDSQPPTSPVGFLFWNFRHRLVRYYWHAKCPSWVASKSMEVSVAEPHVKWPPAPPFFGGAWTVDMAMRDRRSLSASVAISPHKAFQNLQSLSKC